MTNEQQEVIKNAIKRMNELYQKNTGSQYVYLPVKVYNLLFGNHEKYKNSVIIRMSIKDICM